jgi:hypothetical protein
LWRELRLELPMMALASRATRRELLSTGAPPLSQARIFVRTLRRLRMMP